MMKVREKQAFLLITAVILLSFAFFYYCYEKDNKYTRPAHMPGMVLYGWRISGTAGTLCSILRTAGPSTRTSYCPRMKLPTYSGRIFLHRQVWRL